MNSGRARKPGKNGPPKVTGGLFEPGEQHDCIRATEVRHEIVLGDVRRSPLDLPHLESRWRRASPNIDSTCSSFSRKRSTLVPTFPVAPITITRMARSLPTRSTGVTPRVAAKARLPTEWRLTCTLGNSCRPLQE
jgi:hypothetical protein